MIIVFDKNFPLVDLKLTFRQRLKAAFFILLGVLHLRDFRVELEVWLAPVEGERIKNESISGKSRLFAPELKA